MVKNIRKTFNPLSTSDTNEGELLINQRVCMWEDSDNSYLQDMKSPERIEQSIAPGILFTKNVAQITETSQ